MVFRIWNLLECISPSTVKFPTAQYISLLSIYILYAVNMQFSYSLCDLSLHAEIHTILYWNCMKGYHILNFSLHIPFSCQKFCPDRV